MDTFIFRLKTAAYLQITILCLCCSAKSKEDHNYADQPPTQVPKTIYMVSVNHHFSSNDTKDQFIIELYGADTLSGNVKFQIISSFGDLIYSVEFESRALFDYGLAQNPSKADKMKYIITRMSNFFDEENFVIPAIEPNENYDKDYYGIVGESIWNKLKIENDLIGFYYLLWEGNQSWITFYKNDKRAIKYKTCC